jgi:uncharacterized membrane protein (UPF0127 family)
LSAKKFKRDLVFGVLMAALFMPGAQADSPNQICFKDRCFNVEVADNDASRIRGLQGRLSMASDSGMLFVFQQQDLYNFWMKDTLIPLDILWLDRDMQVVDLKADVPPCQDNPCPIYNPSGQALYVLEINAGAAKSYNIQIGQKAVLK